MHHASDHFHGPREGGFAEYITMPERNLVTVPDDIALGVAALAEPIACGWLRCAKPKPF